MENSIEEHLQDLERDEEKMIDAVLLRLAFSIQRLPDFIDLNIIIKSLCRLLSLYTKFDKMEDSKVDAFCQVVTDEIKSYRKQSKNYDIR